MRPKSSTQPASDQAGNTKISSTSNTSMALAGLASRIRQAIDEGNQLCRHGLFQWLRAGELLHEAKAKCPHGSWASWVKDHVGMSDRQAQKYMRLHERRKEITARLEAGDTFVSVNETIQALTAPDRQTPNSLGEKRPPRAVLVSKADDSETKDDLPPMAPEEVERLRMLENKIKEAIDSFCQDTERLNQYAKTASEVDLRKIGYFDHMRRMKTLCDVLDGATPPDALLAI